MASNRMTRSQAISALASAGFPTGEFRNNEGRTSSLITLMLAIGSAESGLYIDAQGLPNSNGTVDRGWIQINEVHGYDPALLLSDPVYTARAGLQILVQQGIRAWAAYGVRDGKGQYPYTQHMPPGKGGADLVKGMPVDLRVQSFQEFLNQGGAGLVADGAFGSKTQAALDAWKKKVGLQGLNVDAVAWTKSGLL